MPAIIEEAPKKEVVATAKTAEIAPVPGAIASKTFSEKFSGKPREAKKEVVKEETAEEKTTREEAEKVAADEKAAAKAAKIAKKATVVAPVASEPDYEKITEAVTKGVRAATPELKAVVVVEDEMNTDEKETLEVLERMEKDYGDEYKGRSEKYKKSLSAARTYKTQWEKDNPGKEFDAEADEHNEFFDKNDVEWDDKHFTRSLARVEADKAAGKVTAKTTEKLNEVERRERARQEEPKAVAHQVSMAKEYFGQLGEDFAKVLDDKGDIKSDEIKRITDADPIKAVVFKAAQTVEVFTGEMFRLINGIADFDTKNRLHTDIAGFINENEDLMKSLPVGKQLNGEGKQFATGDEWAKLTKEQRENRWHYTDKELSELYASNMVATVKNNIAQEEKRLSDYAKARGLAPANNGNGTSHVTPAPVEEVVVETERTPSPSGAIAPRVAEVGAHKNGAAGNAVSTFTKRYIG